MLCGRAQRPTWAHMSTSRSVISLNRRSPVGQLAPSSISCCAPVIYDSRASAPSARAYVSSRSDVAPATTSDDDLLS